MNISVMNVLQYWQLTVIGFGWVSGVGSKGDLLLPIMAVDGSSGFGWVSGVGSKGDLLLPVVAVDSSSGFGWVSGVRSKGDLLLPVF